MVTAVEREVGTEPVRRTTHRSDSSEVGRAFNRRLTAALRKIEAANTEASNPSSEPSGLLRLTGPHSRRSMRFRAVPGGSGGCAAFLNINPKVSVDLELSDGYVVLVDEGFTLRSASRDGGLDVKGQGPRQSPARGDRLADLHRQAQTAEPS